MFEYNFWEGQGIILVWAWNDIKGVTLREGWTGVTDRDIGIRSMLQEFLEVYPEPVLELMEGIRVYTFKDTSTENFFNKNGLLRGINAGYTFYYFTFDTFPKFDLLYDANYVNSELKNVSGTWQGSIDLYIANILTKK